MHLGTSLRPTCLGSRQGVEVGNPSSHKNSNSHIDASHSRQPLVKGERLVRYEVNAVMTLHGMAHDVSHDADATHGWLRGALCHTGGSPPGSPPGESAGMMILMLLNP